MRAFTELETETDGETHRDPETERLRDSEKKTERDNKKDTRSGRDKDRERQKDRASEPWKLRAAWEGLPRGARRGREGETPVLEGTHLRRKQEGRLGPREQQVGDNPEGVFQRPGAPR